MDSKEDMTPYRYGLPKMRRAALDRLARAYAEDDLDLDDYEARAEALEAAASLQDVARVMSDIPDFESQALAPRPPLRDPAGGPGSQGNAPPATAIQILGDRTVDLADFANGEIRIFCLLGDTKVDLSDLRPGETAVVKDFGMLGDFTLRVPAGTQIVRRRVVLLGDEKRVPQKKLRRGKSFRRMQHTPTQEAPPATPHPPRVVIEGFRLLGDTKIVDL